MSLKYLAEKEFPSKDNVLQIYKDEEGFSYRMRTQRHLLEAFLSSNYAKERYVTAKWNIKDKKYLFITIHDSFGIVREIRKGEVGYEESYIPVRDSEYDFFLKPFGAIVSPLFVQAKEKGIDLYERFIDLKPFLL